MKGNHFPLTSEGTFGLRQRVAGLRLRVSVSRQVVRSIGALLGGNIVVTVLAAASGLLVARFLGPDETGPFRAYTIPLTYIMFLHFGTWDGLWHQIPYYVGKEMPDQVDLLASTAGAFNLLVSALVSFGFACGALHSLIHHDLYGTFGWLSQALFAWSVFYGGYLTSTYRTLHHFATLARIQMSQAVLSFVMVFLLPFAGFYGLCARLVLPSILSIWFYQRNRPLRVKYRFDTKTLIALVKLGFPLSFWGSLYTCVWTASEGALILYLAGTTALGLYSVAAVMGAAMSSLPTAVWQVLTPRVVAAFARDGSVRNANARTIWVAAVVTGLMATMAVAVSFLLEVFVPYLMPKYIAGIPVMKVYLWLSVVQAAFLPINTLFATGRPWLYGKSVIAGILVFPLSVYLLHPAIGGLLAVAVGSLLGRLARTTAAYFDLIALTRRSN